MATIRFKRGDDYLLKLERLGSSTDEITRRALYEGAKVVADAVKLNIRGLSLDYYEQYILRDLAESFGITPMRLFGGGWELKLGFDGYGSRRTKKYPRGLPNQLAARAIESGTSFRHKQPFVRPAVNAARNPCREAMKRQIDEDIQKIMK